MGKIVLEKNRLVFQRRDELVVIEGYGRNCLRCRATRNSVISEESWTLLPPTEEADCIIEGDASFASITNGDIRATIEAGFPWYGGIVCFYRKEKQILKTKQEGDYSNKYVHTEGKSLCDKGDF